MECIKNIGDSTTEKHNIKLGTQYTNNSIMDKDEERIILLEDGSVEKNQNETQGKNVYWGEGNKRANRHEIGWKVLIPGSCKERELVKAISAEIKV